MRDNKITVSTGCTDYLVGEVESLRRQNEVLGAQMRVVDSFFGMINRLGDKPSLGYGEDRLWQAKREIREATELANTTVGTA